MMDLHDGDCLAFNTQQAVCIPYIVLAARLDIALCTECLKSGADALLLP